VGGEAPSSGERIEVDEPEVAPGVEPGATVGLGGGTVVLEVVAVEGDTVGARVQAGGRLQGRPGGHLPSDRWRPPVPTEDDLRLIDAVAREADWVAVSFVRRPEELRRVREALGDDGPRLMAKIETRAAAEHPDEPTTRADGATV